MTIIFGLLLVVLGILAAQEFLGEKVPASKSVLEKIASYGEFIGLAGLLFGFIWFLQALNWLRALGDAPGLVLKVFGGSVLTMLLGLLFSLPMLHKFMNEPTPAILLKADKLKGALQPHFKVLGLAAIVLGIICFF